MIKKDGGLTRRDFMRGAAGVAIAGAAGLPASLNRPQEAEKKSSEEEEAKGKKEQRRRSKVVLIRDEKVINGSGRVDAEIVARMLDDGVKALLNEEDAHSAWKRLLMTSDVLGIKSNVWRFLPTPKEVEEAIKRRAIDVGVNEEKIGIDDRGVLRNPVFLQATALINVRTSRTHHWSGVGSCIKNYIMFHPKPWEWHEDSCADLAGLWSMPNVKGKTRLNILVMLTPLFHGKGPHHFQAKYTWPYKGLVIGKDPVAVDATGVRILKAMRRKHFKQDEPFSVPPKHIRVAEEKFKLGVADLDRIDVEKLGWEEGSLI